MRNGRGYHFLVQKLAFLSWFFSLFSLFSLPFLSDVVRCFNFHSFDSLSLGKLLRRSFFLCGSFYLAVSVGTERFYLLFLLS